MYFLFWHLFSYITDRLGLCCVCGFLQSSVGVVFSLAATHLPYFQSSPVLFIVVFQSFVRPWAGQVGSELHKLEFMRLEFRNQGHCQGVVTW